MDECVSCQAGYYANKNASECIACSPGTYQSSSASSTCRSCPTGQYSAAFNATSCDACPLGRYSDQIGQSSCSLCLEEKWEYQLNTGQDKCQTCKTNEYPRFSSNGSFFDCSICPANAVCDFERAQVRALRGYWSTSDPETGSFTITSCPTSLCSAQGSCSDGRLESENNPLCGLCSSGRQPWQGECLECESTRWGELIGLTFLLAITMWVFHKLAQSTSASMKIFLYFVQNTFLIMSADSSLRLEALSCFNLSFLEVTRGNCLFDTTYFTWTYIGTCWYMFCVCLCCSLSFIFSLCVCLHLCLSLCIGIYLSISVPLSLSLSPCHSLFVRISLFLLSHRSVVFALHLCFSHTPLYPFPRPSQ